MIDNIAIVCPFGSSFSRPRPFDFITKRKFHGRSSRCIRSSPAASWLRVYVLNIGHEFRKRRHSVLIRSRVAASGPSSTTPWARLNALFWRSPVSPVNTPVVIQQVQPLARLIFKPVQLENRHSSVARTCSVCMHVALFLSMQWSVVKAAIVLNIPVLWCVLCYRK